MLNELLKQKNMTKYRLSKDSQIPHTTIIDLCSGKTRIEKCSSDTLYKLAKVLNVSMESLVENAMEYRSSFEIFKSNICHMVKDMGDLNFIIKILESDKINKLYQKKWYPECLYLLAMVDYLSRENNLPLCKEYSELRNFQLDEPIFPTSINVLCRITKSEQPKIDSLKVAIPEFLRFNIIEAEVRNVY